MGIGVLIAYVLIFTLLLLAVFLLFYLIRKGKLKTGFVIGSSLILICLSFLFTNTIDSFFFNNSNVKEDLKLANIELLEEFQIINNEVIGMPERWQKTEILIKENDKSRLIKEIKNSKDFKIKDQCCVFRWGNAKLESNNLYSANYKLKDHFVRESYFRKDDYVPTITIVYINEDTNVVSYERIEE